MSLEPIESVFAQIEERVRSIHKESLHLQSDHRQCQREERDIQKALELEHKVAQRNDHQKGILLSKVRDVRNRQSYAQKRFMAFEESESELGNKMKNIKYRMSKYNDLAARDATKIQLAFAENGHLQAEKLKTINDFDGELKLAEEEEARLTAECTALEKSYVNYDEKLGEIEFLINEAENECDKIDDKVAKTREIIEGVFEDSLAQEKEFEKYHLDMDKAFDADVELLQKKTEATKMDIVSRKKELSFAKESQHLEREVFKSLTTEEINLGESASKEIDIGLQLDKDMGSIDEEIKGEESKIQALEESISVEAYEHSQIMSECRRLQMKLDDAGQLDQELERMSKEKDELEVEIKRMDTMRDDLRLEGQRLYFNKFDLEGDKRQFEDKINDFKSQLLFIEMNMGFLRKEEQKAKETLETNNKEIKLKMQQIVNIYTLMEKKEVEGGKKESVVENKPGSKDEKPKMKKPEVKKPEVKKPEVAPKSRPFPPKRTYSLRQMPKKFDPEVFNIFSSSDETELSDIEFGKRPKIFED